MSTAPGAARPSRGVRLTLLAAALAVFAVLLGLGVWQVQRLFWKLELIATVETRLSATPVAAPAPAEWAALTAGAAEYRRVTVSGHYAEGPQRRVKAVTVRGPGFWVMTPLISDAGWPVLVSRGFVPDGTPEIAAPAGPVRVSGLLRMSQPKGAFLRRNDPQAGRWFSRDTAAIGADLGLSGIAPYFIDAEAGPDPEALPIGGLTVVRFRNTHLAYAATWFALAALWAGWLIYLRRSRKAAD
ncbi:SURF1 family protein [Paracoccus sp. (in: a-proteobacteria)]|uniref:SURF1 family protein n=1 Tax=Paracoccus sp. TaxID=267 RepID=UPI0035AEE84C